MLLLFDYRPDSIFKKYKILFVFLFSLYFRVNLSSLFYVYLIKKNTYFSRFFYFFCHVFPPFHLNLLVYYLFFCVLQFCVTPSYTFVVHHITYAPANAMKACGSYTSARF
jgi:hypothetical protein